jgi:hypothetical protein
MALAAGAQASRPVVLERPAGIVGSALVKREFDPAELPRSAGRIE